MMFTDPTGQYSWKEFKEDMAFAWDSVSENGGAFFEGVGEAAAELVTEPIKMAHDLGHAAYGVAKYAVTGELHDFEMMSALGKGAEAGNTIGDNVVGMVTGIVQAPWEFGQALVSGDPKRIGKATFNFEAAILGSRGVQIKPKAIVQQVKATVKGAPKVIVEGAKKAASSVKEVGTKATNTIKAAASKVKQVNREFNKQYAKLSEGQMASGVDIMKVAKAANETAKKFDAPDILTKDLIKGSQNTPPKGGTYKLRDPETGQVRRTGRAKDLEMREKQHARNEVTKDLDFEVDRRTDIYEQQRGREQVIHDLYPEARHPKHPLGGTEGGLNKVRAIRENHPRRYQYLAAAKDLE